MLRVLTNVGDPLIDGGSNPLAGVLIHFIMVDEDDYPVASFDTVSGEMVIPKRISVVTDVLGEFSVPLWVTANLDRAVYWLCTVKQSNVLPFKSIIAEGVTDLTFAEFRASSSPATPAQFDALVAAVTSAISVHLLDPAHGAINHTNRSAIDRISATAGNPPLWDGLVWPGGNGGGLTVFDHEPSTEEVAALGLYDTNGGLQDITGFYTVRSPVETEPPVVTAFTVPATSSSFAIPISSFLATDNDQVAEYMITTSATPPTLGQQGWSLTAPSTYVVTAEGSIVLYPWAKDRSGNVSAVFATPRTVAVDNALPYFTAQPTVLSVGATSIILGYATSDAENDHYKVEGSSDGGTTWVEKVADEMFGTGKTASFSGLTAATLYTLQLRLTALTGDTTPILSNTVQGTTSTHSPTFSVQPTATATIDGANFSFTVADALIHNLDIEFYNGATWARTHSGVAAGAKTSAWTGQSAGSKAGCKFRVADAGSNAWVESSVVPIFSTASPAIISVTAGAAQLSIDITAPAGYDSLNGYHSASAGQEITAMTKVTGVADPWVLTGLTAGQVRYLKVTAVEGATESLPSLESYGTPSAASTLYTTTFDPARKGAVNVLSNNNLTLTDPTGWDSWNTCFTIDGKTTGTVQTKVRLDDIVPAGGVIIGFADVTAGTTGAYLGMNSLSLGWNGLGVPFYSGTSNDSQFATRSAGDVLLFELDCSTRKVRVSINDGSTWSAWSVAISGSGAIYLCVSAIEGPVVVTLI